MGSSATDAGRVLVVDDEIGIRAFLAEVLADAGHEVAQAGTGEDALTQLRDRPFDLMMLDLRMPGELSGLDVLRRARAEWPHLQVVVLTANGTVSTAVEAMRMGAFDFLEKPVQSPQALRNLVTRALNWRAAARGPAWGVTRSDAPTLLSSSGTFARLLWQLRRRHVYKVMATYAAIGFLGLQSAELVLPALPVPAWLYPLFTAIVLAGFPVAIALGWLYDITASGITRTRLLKGPS
jgi:DNA-binding NtrC family response regulator